MKELSVFTQQAMKMAREKMYNEDNQKGIVYREPIQHLVKLMLSDNDIEMLNKLFELGIAKSNEIITRSRNHPSETIRSTITIKKHTEIIQHIESLSNQLSNEAQW